MTAERRLIEHYAAVRQRCYGRMQTQPQRKAVVYRPIVQVQPVIPAELTAWRRILEEVAHKHMVSVDTLIGRKKKRWLALPRAEAMYRMHHELGMSLSAVGRRMGGRDHSTISHHLKQLS